MNNSELIHVFNLAYDTISEEWGEDHWKVKGLLLDIKRAISALKDRH